MINNRVVKSCFLRCFQSPSSERQVLALPMPRRGKGAWLGGCQEFSIEQHLLFLTIFLQLCSGQLDSPPHLKRNHPARETSASPTIKEVPNFKRACKRQNKFLASNVDQTAFPIVLDHHCYKEENGTALPVSVPLVGNQLPGQGARGGSGGQYHRVLWVGAPLTTEGKPLFRN